MWFSGLVASHSDKSPSQKVVLRYLTIYATSATMCKKGSPHIGAGIPSEISYWTFCGWQIHRGVSRGTPTLLCQIKLQYFAAKNGWFWALPDWVKCRNGQCVGICEDSDGDEIGASIMMLLTFCKNSQLYKEVFCCTILWNFLVEKISVLFF